MGGGGQTVNGRTEVGTCDSDESIRLFSHSIMQMVKSTKERRRLFVRFVSRKASYLRLF